jgi:hypothetical protein
MIVEQWRRLHPQKVETDGGLGIDPFDPATTDAMLEYSAAENEVVADIAGRITADKVAEIDAMFYLARDRLLSENYEDSIKTAQMELAAAGDPEEKIAHLMEKTNFLQCLQDAARKLGHLSLADRLSKM